MGETRQQIKERLQAAGLWQDYLTLREKLVAEGLAPAQAREEALRQIDSRPRQPSEPVDQKWISDSSPEQAPMEGDLDFSRNVPNYDAAQWVAHNIANSRVRAEDSPSALAWGLLMWVRQPPGNQSTFWGSIWPKLLPTGAALRQQQDKEWDKEGACPTCGREPDKPDEGLERGLELIKILDDKFHKEQAEEDAKIAARPDAAKIGATLQHRLEATLEREAMWRRQAEELRAKVEDLESNGAKKKADRAGSRIGAER